MNYDLRGKSKRIPCGESSDISGVSVNASQIQASNNENRSFEIHDKFAILYRSQQNPARGQTLEANSLSVLIQITGILSEAYPSFILIQGWCLTWDCKSRKHLFVLFCCIKNPVR